MFRIVSCSKVAYKFLSAASCRKPVSASLHQVQSPVPHLSDSCQYLPLRLNIKNAVCFFSASENAAKSSTEYTNWGQVIA